MCSAKPIDGFPTFPMKYLPLNFSSLRKDQSFSNKKDFFPERSPSASARNVSEKGLLWAREEKKNNTRMQAPSSVWFQSYSACLLEFDWSLPPEHRAREHRERVFMLDRGKEVNRLEIRFRDFKRKGGGLGKWKLLLMGNGQGEGAKEKLFVRLERWDGNGKCWKFSLEVHRPGTFICFEWNAVGHFNWSPWVINIHCWIIGSGKLLHPLGVDRLAFVESHEK